MSGRISRQMNKKFIPRLQDQEKRKNKNTNKKDLLLILSTKTQS